MLIVGWAWDIMGKHGTSTQKEAISVAPERKSATMPANSGTLSLQRKNYSILVGWKANLMFYLGFVLVMFCKCSLTRFEENQYGAQSQRLVRVGFHGTTPHRTVRQRHIPSDAETPESGPTTRYGRHTEMLPKTRGIPPSRATGAARPHWAARPGSGVRRPVSRVLSRPVRAGDDHSSGTPVAGRLARPTRAAAGNGRGRRDRRPSAPIRSCSRWGLPCRPRCRGRGALLPHPFTLAGRRGRSPRGPAVCSLWHFPWGRPRRALPGTVFPWSPDFPPPAPKAGGGHPAV